MNWLDFYNVEFPRMTDTQAENIQELLQKDFPDISNHEISRAIRTLKQRDIGRDREQYQYRGPGYSELRNEIEDNRTRDEARRRNDGYEPPKPVELKHGLNELEIRDDGNPCNHTLEQWKKGDEYMNFLHIKRAHPALYAEFQEKWPLEASSGFLRDFCAHEWKPYSPSLPLGGIDDYKCRECGRVIMVRAGTEPSVKNHIFKKLAV